MILIQENYIGDTDTDICDTDIGELYVGDTDTDIGDADIGEHFTVQ